MNTVCCVQAVSEERTKSMGLGIWYQGEYSVSWWEYGLWKTVGAAAGMSWRNSGACGTGDPKSMRAVETTTKIIPRTEAWDGIPAGVVGITVNFMANLDSGAGKWWIEPTRRSITMRLIFLGLIECWIPAGGRSCWWCQDYQWTVSRRIRWLLYSGPLILGLPPWGQWYMVQPLAQRMKEIRNNSREPLSPTP